MTAAHLVQKAWNTLNQRTINGRSPQRTPRNDAYFRRGTRLEFTRDEFSRWVHAHWSEFERIYQMGRTPSIDRIEIGRAHV